MSLTTADIERVSEQLGALAGADVAGLNDAILLEAQEAAGKLGRLVTAVQARLAGEVARRSAPGAPHGGLARQSGFRSPQELIARNTGGTKAGARRLIEAGSAFAPPPAQDAGTLVGADGGDSPGLGPSPSSARPAPRYPLIAAAHMAGDLSVESAGLMTAGLDQIREEVDTDELGRLEQRWVSRAVTRTATEVRRMVDTAVARASQVRLEERERQRHANRFVAWREDHEGMVHITARLDPVSAAPVLTTIEQIVTADFRARRDQDPTSPDQRTVGQMRADALAVLCRHALGCDATDRSGVRTTMVVRMSLADLESGRGVGTIDGIGQPVSVRELRRAAGDAEIIPHVLSGDGETLDWGRKRRMFSAAQRLALVERDGGCARCHAPPEHCEAHHIRWWTKDRGPTDLSNGVMLCTRCHHDIHAFGWRIQVQGGQVWFQPPPTAEGRPRPPILGGRDSWDFERAKVPARTAPPPWSSDYISAAEIDAAIAQLERDAALPYEPTAEFWHEAAQWEERNRGRESVHEG